MEILQNLMGGKKKPAAFFILSCYGEDAARVEEFPLCLQRHKGHNIQKYSRPPLYLVLLKHRKSFQQKAVTSCQQVNMVMVVHKD